MGLWFQNGYTDPVYIAMLWYDPGCSGEPWRKSGWYEVASGSSVEIVGANLQTIPDPNFAWFAQADWADGPCWSGDPAHSWYAIPHNAAFSQCYSDNAGCNAAYPFNVAALNRSSPDWTIVLLEPGAAGRGFQGCSFGFPGQPTAHLLNFTVPSQLESNWCWAAVSTGVAHYYNSASAVTQCQVVNAQLGRSDCCRNPGSSNCNVTGYLQTALTFVGHLQSMQNSAATYAAASAAVDAGTPPCIRIGWSGGGGHFIGVFGIEPSNMVWVTDPIYGQSLVSYATLTGGTYQGSGTWTHTYFTR
jgi:Papain-like cysteine protease AvrRpt2